MGFASLVNRLALSGLAQTTLGLLNRLPFPYTHLPLRVGDVVLRAHTFDRYLALWLWKMGGQEARELKLLGQLCRPGMHAVDIGANIGVFTLRLAQLVGSQGHVWAFEPDPGNFAMLRANLSANACQNVTAVQRAVGARTGTLNLYRSKGHNGDHRLYASAGESRESLAVEVAALDDFFPASQPIDLIKMDIQGAEGMALAGMHGLLQRMALLTVMLEFWPDGLRRANAEPAQLLAKLQNLGFRLSAVGARDQSMLTVENTGEFTSSLGHKRHANIVGSKQSTAVLAPT